MIANGNPETISRSATSATSSTPRALSTTGRIAKPIHTKKATETKRPAMARRARFTSFVNGLEGQASATREAAHFGSKRSISGPRIYRVCITWTRLVP